EEAVPMAARDDEIGAGLLGEIQDLMRWIAAQHASRDGDAVSRRERILHSLEAVFDGAGEPIARYLVHGRRELWGDDIRRRERRARREERLREAKRGNGAGAEVERRDGALGQ